MNKDIENSYIESALYRIQRLKSRIVTQISHEFRTPLTSIIGFAEMLQDEVEIEESQRIEFARYIRDEGLRLSKLVDDLIQLDALEHGRVKFKLNETDIHSVVKKAMALVSEFALSRSIVIRKELPIEPIRVKIDCKRITQALFQLLHNAVSFSKPDGIVLVKVEPNCRNIKISIQDNGMGIPEKNIPTLFKRFEKLYNPGEESHGTGVGLAIVKHIIDQHNGDINVQSQVGMGSTFTLLIPIIA